jgi:hypothetical protein
MLWNKQEFIISAGNRTRAIQPAARRYTDRAIPAPLKQRGMHNTAQIVLQGPVKDPLFIRYNV